MRVLVVTTWYPTPSAPGTGIFVARDVAALASRHEVHVLHLCAPRLMDAGDGSEQAAEGEQPGVATVERLPMDPRRPDHILRATRRIRELSEHADLIHTMAVSALLPMATWRPSTPWVHTEHWSGVIAPDSLAPTVRAARPLVARLLRRPDVVLVVSEHLAAGMRRLRRGPVVVVPNIVAPTEPPATRRAAAEPLAERGTLALIGIGGLIEGKDPLTAVGTAAELRRRGIDAHLTWVGEGPLRQRMTELAADLAVPLDLTGALPPEQVGHRLAEADLFLLPTRFETFCLAAAEALAAGRPVVVGDAGGPREFVAAPSGALVEPGAPAERWADAVEQVWASASPLSAEDIAAPVRERYAPQRHLERVEEVYASVTAGERRSGQGEEADPLVDVVIATHSPQRAAARAAASVLDGSGDLPVRVSVVCHNLTTEQIAATFPPHLLQDPRLRLLELHDGIPSPAGPFSHGLEAATAPWVSIMGSDDQLSPGALAHWLEVARATGAEVVLARVELDGTPLATPPSRLAPTSGVDRRWGVRDLLDPRRRTDLDLVRDRLAYRSAPLGLLSRAAIGRTGARLLPGARTGEDVSFTLRLLDGAGTALAESAPYLIGTDAGDRTTYAPRPVAEELRAVTDLLADPWLAGLDPAAREAVCTKLLRVHVFGSVLLRTDPGRWTPGERADLAGVARRLLEVAPGCADPLSLADHDLLEAVLDPDVPAPTLIERAHARRRFGTPRTLLPRRWSHVLHREAPLRFMAASLVARRG